MPCMNCPLPDHIQVCGDTTELMYLEFVLHVINWHADPGTKAKLEKELKVDAKTP